tara:strand:- start:104 stop:343 length:240 start_codon:yes stop_codon:yes gene_type:complete
VDLNGPLNRKNYGNKHMGNGGVCVWTNSTFANFKINKQTKRKRNSRGQLQGRLMHHSNLLRDGGVEITRYYANTCKKFY